MQGPGMLGDSAHLQSPGGPQTHELGEESGAGRYHHPYSLPGWAPERDRQWEITALTHGDLPLAGYDYVSFNPPQTS